MARPIHFKPLDSSDAKSIRSLQKSLFPPDLCEDVEEIRQLLKRTEAHMVCNYSFGVFDGPKMVGYVFAYVEANSVFHNRKEDVVYIKEIGLLPGYERTLRRVFAKLFLQWSAFTPGIAIEAHVLRESLRNWKRLARMHRFYGLRLSTKPEPQKAGRPPYILLRFDVDDATANLAEQASPMPRKAAFADGNIGVFLITEPQQWLSLEPIWEELLAATNDSNVFQSFDYLWQWWKYMGIWNDLRVFVIKRGDAVIGIVPMMCEYFEIFGKTIRKLMFITAPMEMSRPKLIFGRNESICIPAFCACLASVESEWDIIDIDEQVMDWRKDTLLTTLSPRNYLTAESETPCPYIEIDTDWAGFKAGLSRKMRSNINRLRRRLAETGDVSVRYDNRWPELDSALDQFCDLEQRSWKAAKSLHIENDREHYFFYHGLCKAFGKRGCFEMRTLQCGDQPVASTFGIRKGDVYQSLKIVHDREYDKLSPGTVLESFELEDLFGQGIKLYEFMGGFLTNKLRWTSSVHLTRNVHIYQRGPRLSTYFFIYFVLKRRVKTLLKKTGQFERAERLVKSLSKNSRP